MKNCYADSHLFADDYPLFNTKLSVRISMGSITPVQKAHNYLHKGIAILL